MALVKLAKQIIRILYKILFTVVPYKVMVDAMLSLGYDQIRIIMQEHVKKLSDAELNEAIEDHDQNRPWPGKSEGYRKKLEKAGLLSVIVKALQDEKFLREYKREQDTPLVAGRSGACSGSSSSNSKAK